MPAEQNATRPRLYRVQIRKMIELWDQKILSKYQTAKISPLRCMIAIWRDHLRRVTKSPNWQTPLVHLPARAPRQTPMLWNHHVAKTPEIRRLFALHFLHSLLLHLLCFPHLAPKLPPSASHLDNLLPSTWRILSLCRKVCIITQPAMTYPFSTVPKNQPQQ